MQTAEVADLFALYERDETAWLETMSDLIRAGRLGELDYRNLAEFLSDMAKRERREVASRLAVLLAHLLKWEYQTEFRSGSWRSTIELQRAELDDAMERGVLRNHAEEVLNKAYSKAIGKASSETGFPPSTFPSECPFTLDAALTQPLEINAD